MKCLFAWCLTVEMLWCEHWGLAYLWVIWLVCPAGVDSRYSGSADLFPPLAIENSHTFCPCFCGILCLYLLLIVEHWFSLNKCVILMNPSSFIIKIQLLHFLALWILNICVWNAAMFFSAFCLCFKLRISWDFYTFGFVIV